MRYSQFLREFSISVSLEPDAAQALATWEGRYHAEFKELAFLASQLHIAIVGQKPTTARGELLGLFSAWETAVLDTYMTVGDSLVPKLKCGLGNAVTIAEFEAAVGKLPAYFGRYRYLRTRLNTLLDQEGHI